jgi:hypothetical protein
MSAWTVTPVNGVLADSLVTSFGSTVSGVDAPSTALPPDSRMCLEFHYSSTAATQVVIYLATTAGATGDNIVMIYDSALQTVPAANSTQYLTGICVDVPIVAGTLVPMQLRITKAASTANIRWATTVKMGPCC